MPGKAGTAGGVSRWRGAVVIPYAWLIVFFLVPFLIVFKISLSETAIAQPPYLPVLDFSAGWDGFKRFLAGKASGEEESPSFRVAAIAGR